MEHRNGNRMPINLDVELVSKDRAYGVFTSRNISHSGLFVNGRKALKKGDVLTAKFATGDSRSPQRHQLKVMVVHNSENGTGLMWTDHNIPFSNALDFMMSSVA